MGIINLKAIEKNKKKPRPKRPANAKARDLYDYCSVGKDKSVIKLMDEAGETGISRIFSDYITRINSNCERKMRVCYITGKKKLN